MTTEQTARRAHSIGGSDVAALFGLSPWQQPMDVYRRLVGEAETEEAPLEDDDPRLLGQEFEATIREQWRRRLERDYGAAVRVIAPRQAMVHPRIEYLHGHIDAIAQVVRPRRIGEMKLVVDPRQRANWGEQGTDDVPEHYLLQCQTYLAVSGFEVADLCPWFGPRDFRRYVIHRSEELIEIIEARVVEFWRQHVECREPPPIDYGHRHAIALLRLIYDTVDTTETVELPAAAAAVHETRRLAQEARRRADATIAFCDAQILDWMATASVGYLPLAPGQSRQTAYVRSRVERAAYQVEASTYVRLDYRSNPPRARAASKREGDNE